MKAIIYRECGTPDVLRCEEVEMPVPGDGQVLIKVKSASLNPVDKHMMKGVPWLFRVLFRMPKVSAANPGRFGRDVAGVVETIGPNVTEFKPGDEVFGVSPGACAEYACANAAKIVIKPAGVTFEQAASSPVVAFTALQALRDKGKVQPGQKVLINGASGGVGTYAVQIAKSFGAEVTGVCSTRNLDLVRSIGADHVIDYTKEDFAKSDQRYDLIIECVANHSLSDYRRILKPTGSCILIGGPDKEGMGGYMVILLKALVSSWFSNKKIAPYMAKTNQDDLRIAGELMVSGKLKPVIDRTYPLSETPDAVRYLAAKHAQGKVIITID